MKQNSEQTIEKKQNSKGIAKPMLPAVVLIFEPLQRNKAMLGHELIGSSSAGSCHAGAWISSTRRFIVGDKEFTGDFCVCRFTAKNAMLFKYVVNDYDTYLSLDNGR